MANPDRNLVSRFARRAASFGSLLLGVKVLNFLFLPVYWRLVDKSSFGTVAVAQGLSVVLAPLLNFGLSSSISRLYKDYDARGQGRDLLGSCFVVASLAGVATCAVLSLAGGPLLERLFPDVAFRPYLLIAVWSGFFLSLDLFGEQVVRVTDSLRLNATFVILEFVLKNALILALVFLLEDGALAFLLGEMGALGILGAGYASACLRGARLRMGWRFLRDPIVLALPVIPAGMLSQLVSNLDRFILLRCIPRADLGVYGQAMKLGAPFDLLARALKTVWFPTLLKTEARTPEKEALIRKSYLFVFDALGGVVLTVAFLGIPAIWCVAPAGYWDMAPFLPAVGVVMLVKNFAFLPSLRLLTTRFSLSALIAVSATAAVGIGLHLAFTVRFGIVGAIASLGGSYLFSCAVTEALARIATPARLPWGALAARFALVSAAAAGATGLALLGRSPWIAAAQIGAFAVTALPLAAWYWHQRADFFRSRPQNEPEAPPPVDPGP